jgi:sugar lactone lactonase YvrE
VTTTIVTGLGFPESPRWHDDALWFVDVFRGRVMRTDGGGSAAIVAEIDDDVSGMGFLPDGAPLVVSMRRRQVLRLGPDGPSLHADLGALTAGYLNDMVVDGSGRAFVGAIANPVDPGDGVGHDALVTVAPAGEAEVAATGVFRPNGMVVTPDGRTLIQAATRRRELVAWSIGPEGGLTEPRRWAATGRHTPDGICLDEEGAVWVAGLAERSFIRVLPGGAVTQEIHLDGRWAIACALGGSSGRTLFMATAIPGRLPIQSHPGEPQGFIEATDVSVAGAGSP